MMHGVGHLRRFCEGSLGKASIALHWSGGVTFSFWHSYSFAGLAFLLAFPKRARRCYCRCTYI